MEHLAVPPPEKNAGLDHYAKTVDGVA